MTVYKLKNFDWCRDPREKLDSSFFLEASKDNFTKTKIEKQ